MSKIYSLIALAALTGCATFAQMDEGLAALRGQDVKVAFDVLGYPDGKQQFGNDTVYLWSQNTSGAILMPQNTYTYGAVGYRPMYSTTMGNQVVPVSGNCVVKIITDSTDHIMRTDYNGNMMGCEGYIKRLKAYADRDKPKPWMPSADDSGSINP